MSINERFFKTLEEKGIKASEIAKSLNVNNSIISAWKTRGTNPPIEYTVQICKLLGISIEYYITGKDSNELSDEEQELLNFYRQLPEKEQLRELGRLEARAEMFKGKLSESKIG